MRKKLFEYVDGNQFKLLEVNEHLSNVEKLKKLETELKKNHPDIWDTVFVFAKSNADQGRIENPSHYLKRPDYNEYQLKMNLDDPKSITRVDKAYDKALDAYDNEYAGSILGSVPYVGPMEEGLPSDDCFSDIGKKRGGYTPDELQQIINSIVTII